MDLNLLHPSISRNRVSSGTRLPGRLKTIRRAAAILSFLGFVGITSAAEENLSLDANDSKLTFIGDSFLHSFHGEAKEISGNAEVDASENPPVQKATLRFKTAALTTFEKDRDKKMYAWLNVNAHPDAVFSLEKVRLLEGDSKAADAQHPARFSVSGVLTLNGAKQTITGSALGWREHDRLIVAGEYVIDTLKYGLPQIKEAFMTVGTNVKTKYRFSFILPPEYAAK